ncbi:hypothetical protein SAMN05444164_1235 [Bradyrhizobium erythrophlei]|uniref:Uncharacterized protein n=1 Tax=Bradyrhizobium erythrophlei TaxID=1437360 RepID=A0A1H4QG61_9BRAD|nr:hypothetical protein SAMN05444164_1235 [Bradyrhizobium erythrophlei]
MGQIRRRVMQADTLEIRLTQGAKELRDRAGQLPAGRDRDALLQRAQHNEAAAHMSEWLMSPGQRTPI